MVGDLPARSRLARAWPAVVAGPLVLSGCSTEDVLRLGWPDGITPQADQMESLWIGSVAAALVVGAFVWGLILWCVVRYRKKSDELPVQTRYNLPIEVLYTITPFLIVAVLFYYTVIVQAEVDKETRNPDVTVSVVAYKWNWQFAYPRETDAQGSPVKTVGSSEVIPILVVPTGKRIRFVETSNDVVHSFWVPAVLFKRDVVPGRTNSFEVTIDKPGSYIGRCAEYCGTYHATMNFEMRAVSFEDYQRFIAEKKAGKSTQDALRAIGQEPYAVTTRPFDTKRGVHHDEAARGPHHD